eukprot:8048020-Pyramimonas_sp.AAC.1
MLDRADIMDVRERAMFHGRAGEYKFEWKVVQPKQNALPDEVEAWRVLGRWIRHLRGVRCRLQSLLLLVNRDVEYIGKVVYDLNGFFRRIRRGGWVMDHLTEEAKDFISDIVANFSNSDFCERAQCFLDIVDGKVTAHAEGAAESWARWANDAFAGGACLLYTSPSPRDRSLS